MLSPTASTNLIQKHLKVMLLQWQQNHEPEVRASIEYAFTLLMNRALALLLEEEAALDGSLNRGKFSDFTAFIKSENSTLRSTPLQTELSSALNNPQHWLAAWYQAWETLGYSPQRASNEGVVMIATETHPNQQRDLQGWFYQFNELVESVRTQNDYC